MNEGGYRVPGRDIDDTAVAQEKIRQSAETTRKGIEEKEKTKRERIQRNREKWTDQGFQVVVTLSVLGVCVVAAILGGMHISAHTPEPPGPAVCKESSEIINPDTPVRACGPGGRMETESLATGMGGGTKVLIHCVCPALHPLPTKPEVASDAGKP